MCILQQMNIVVLDRDQSDLTLEVMCNYCVP